MNVFLTHARERWRGMTLKEKSLFFSVSAVIAVLLVFLASTITGRTGLLIVQSGSMHKTMPPGTLLVFKAAEIEDIQAGEVIAFRENKFSNSLVAHRAVDKIFDKGEIYFRTKGDSNHQADKALVGRDELVGRIVSIIPGVGHAVAFTKTSVGMLILNSMLVLLISLIIFEKRGLGGKAYTPQHRQLRQEQ